MFQSGKELEDLYYTEAAFYKLRTHDKIHLCRSVASIRRTGTESEKADALFVLLNPGKCLPVGGEESVPLWNGEIERLPLLPAVPDNSMCQLMRLMERMGWNHVRIINLTDLRTLTYEEHLENQLLMKLHRESRHDLFSIDRYGELLDYVEDIDLIIAGWGTKSAILPAAENAYTILSELAEVKGLSYKTHPLYYHPFPWLHHKCVKWLDNMEEQLKRVEETV